jgi:hypothetical protein
MYRVLGVFWIMHEWTSVSQNPCKIGLFGDPRYGNYYRRYGYRSSALGYDLARIQTSEFNYVQDDDKINPNNKADQPTDIPLMLSCFLFTIESLLNGRWGSSVLKFNHSACLVVPFHGIIWIVIDFREFFKTCYILIRLLVNVMELPRRFFW